MLDEVLVDIIRRQPPLLQIPDLDNESPMDDDLLQLSRSRRPRQWTKTPIREFGQTKLAVEPSLVPPRPRAFGSKVNVLSRLLLPEMKSNAADNIDLKTPLGGRCT